MGDSDGRDAVAKKKRYPDSDDQALGGTQVWSRLPNLLRSCRLALPVSAFVLLTLTGCSHDRSGNALPAGDGGVGTAMTGFVPDAGQPQQTAATAEATALGAAVGSAVGGMLSRSWT